MNEGTTAAARQEAAAGLDRLQAHLGAVGAAEELPPPGELDYRELLEQYYKALSE